MSPGGRVRAFIALELDLGLRGAIGELQARLRPRLGGIRLVRPEAVHLSDEEGTVYGVTEGGRNLESLSELSGRHLEVQRRRMESQEPAAHRTARDRDPALAIDLIDTHLLPSNTSATA